ncbi:unnamed protein product [Pleuronectes platessa]|uniref:Uncharacterized protein n=1 Tax=Pleuronectes platessa TaxID=8262 RepID=A0A9N7YCI6_PLEPL|nr:unnamed protein product [Pleuronectes platessa]
MHDMSPLEAQPSFSVVTSLGCSLVSPSLLLSLSLSLSGADRIIFCIRAEAGPTLHTEDSISHSQPHCGQGDAANHAGVSVALAIHHFVLLKVFDCPAQLSGAVASLHSLCYLVTQMEVFKFRSTDLSEQLPLLSVPLQNVTTAEPVWIPSIRPLLFLLNEGLVQWHHTAQGTGVSKEFRIFSTTGSSRLTELVHCVSSEEHINRDFRLET